MSLNRRDILKVGAGLFGGAVTFRDLAIRDSDDSTEQYTPIQDGRYKCIGQFTLFAATVVHHNEKLEERKVAVFSCRGAMIVEVKGDPVSATYSCVPERELKMRVDKSVEIIGFEVRILDGPLKGGVFAQESRFDVYEGMIVSWRPY